MNTLIAHILNVERELNKLPLHSVFLFGASCAERQYLVYKRAAKDKSWEKIPLFRASLDAVWEFSINHTPIPDLLIAECEESTTSEAFDEDDESTLAFQVANSIFNLATSANTRAPKYVCRTAQAGVDLISGFLYEVLELPSVSEDNDDIVNRHELMVEELARQNRDLLSLKNEITVLEMDNFRRNSSGNSILGKYWYT